MSGLTFEKEQVEEIAKPTSALAGLLSRKKPADDVITSSRISDSQASAIGLGGTQLTLQASNPAHTSNIITNDCFTATVFFPSLKAVTVTVSQACSIRLFVERVVRECVEDHSCLEDIVIFLMAANAEGEVDEDLPVLDDRRPVTTFGINHFTLTATRTSRPQDNGEDLAATSILKFNSIQPCKTDIHIGGAESVANLLSPHARLLRAAEDGDLDEVESMVKKGVDVCVAGKDDWTALHFAARQGHLPVVNFLLKNSAGLDVATTNGWTPLHLACYQGHFVVAEILLTCGATQTLKDSKGHTPLSYAVQKKQTELAELLQEFLEEEEAERKAQEEEAAAAAAAAAN